MRMQYGGQQGYDSGYGAQQGYQDYGAQQSFLADKVAQQNYNSNGVPVSWRIEPFYGVQAMPQYRFPALPKYAYLPYTVRNGEDQVLSRWNMLDQKLTVSRVQAVVQVLPDGTAALESRGKGPTLWRERGGPWYAIQKGERAALAEGDQVALDPVNPESAVFTCQDQRALQQISEYAQGGVSQSQRFFVQATNDFTGQQAGDLGFRAGDVIEVTQQGEPGGWWEGTLNDQIGWFPSNFCSEPFYQ